MEERTWEVSIGRVGFGVWWGESEGWRLEVVSIERRKGGVLWWGSGVK